ncbi:MAG: Glutamyl-tRNA(Gln) amidotransferase subunit A [Syntrophomonadaceae bacterium]|nr:Glutamyl-tRNA(Gln) amidotransferase subunit A [Bacillota bacterium]
MFAEMTVASALEMLGRRDISACELTAAALQRIKDTDEVIRAFVTLTEEKAMTAAEEADRQRTAGAAAGGLAGIPMALKDNISTRGIRTTCSSRMLHNFVPPYDAAVTELLGQSGAVLLGKTNLDEFAMGSSTEHSAFFPTRNPWDTERVAGGSSGGSAAAVAAGQALFALGSDTGGSIRQPAAFCGVVGMKPTYGRVSRYGLVAFASSLDQIGPLTRDVRDCAMVLSAIAVHDRRDSTSAAVETPDYTAFLEGGVRGIRIGVPREYFAAGIDQNVKNTVRQALRVLISLGAEAEEISLPHTEYGIPIYYLIAPAEASSNLARYDGVQYGFRAESDSLWEQFRKTRSQGFGAEVKRRIMLGTYALSSGYYDAHYLKALQARTLIKRDFDEAFARYDVLLTPTTPTAAFPVGAVEDPLTMYMNDICTIPVNLAGLPALSLPCGFICGLPVGMQLIGRPFDEGMLLRVAYAYEQHSGLQKERPQLPRQRGNSQ